MQSNEPHFHYVATLGEVRELVEQFDRFWVSNCGCREGGDGCKRSRLDLCLFFDPQMGGTGTDFKEVDRAFVHGILKETEEKRLVSRPFRYEDDKSRVQGICFCCDDCCWYFTKEGAYECDRGKYVERTDSDSCEDCGTCVNVCYYGAREIVDGKLSVARDDCFGCALCADVCPEGCVTMVER
jgi:NAD-dependent dihydropyrimidine dehydrogenase PreA subunit